MPLYAAAGGSSVSKLWTIDPDDGTPTSIGSTGIAITGLAFDPTSGILYASTSNGSPGGTGRKLYTIDPVTAVATLIGAFGLGGSVTCADISFKADGTLYGLTSFNGDLATINKATGAATVLFNGPSGPGGGFEIDGCDYSVASVETEQGLIEHFDLTTGEPVTIGAFSGADDNNPVPAIACDEDGLMWAWGNTFDETNDLFTFGLDGAITLVAQVPIDPDTELSWDALAWSTPKGCLTIPTPCGNDAFEDAFELLEGVPSCCTTWGATDTAENEAGFSPAFDAPVTWYFYDPSTDHEVLFANGDAAVTLMVYEGNPGDSLATIGAASPGNIVATVAPGSNASVNVLAAKTYYIAVTGYGGFALAVYDGAVYPQHTFDVLGAVGSDVALSPPTSNHFFYCSSAAIEHPDGDLRVAVIEVLCVGGNSGDPVTAEAIIYKFDGAAWSVDEVLDSWTYADILPLIAGTPGTADWIGFADASVYIQAQRASIALTTDGTDVWCGVAVYEYECWAARPSVVSALTKVQMYLAGGGGLVNTGSGDVYINVAPSGTPQPNSAVIGRMFQFYSGGTVEPRIIARGDLRGAARAGVAYFGLAEAGNTSPTGVSVGASGSSGYVGQIKILGTDGSSSIPFTLDPTGGGNATTWTWTSPSNCDYTIVWGTTFTEQAVAFRPDFDLIVNSAGNVLTFMADGPGDPGMTGTFTWGLKLLSSSGTVLQTYTDPFDVTTGKVMSPVVSRSELGGLYYVGVSVGPGISPGGAPKVFSDGTCAEIVLSVPFDGSGSFVEVGRPNYDGSAGGYGAVIPDAGADSTTIWAFSVSQMFAGTSFQVLSGGIAAGQRAFAGRLTKCFAATTFSVGQSLTQIGTRGSTTGHDAFDLGLISQSGVLIGDTLYGVAMATLDSVGIVASTVLHAYQVAITRDGGNCARVVPTPECIVTLDGVDLTFEFRVDSA